MISNTTLAQIVAFASFVIYSYLPQFAIPGSALWTFLVLYPVLAIIRWIYIVIISSYFLSPLRDLPSPPGGTFLMGHAPALFQNPIGFPQIKWLNTIPNNGLIHYRVSWNASRIIPTTPSALSEVLVSSSYTFIKPQQSHDFLAPVLGTGILLAEGSEHKRQRKALMPAFHYRHVKNLYPLFWEQAGKMVDAIKKEGGGGEWKVDVSDWVTRATLDIIGAAGLGQSFRAIEDPRNELHQAYKRVFSPSSMTKFERYLRFYLPLRVFRRLPLQVNYDEVETIRVIRAAARDMIRSKEAKLAADENEVESMNTDILTVALKSGDFSEEDLVNQLMTFLVAGHETTATAMMWAVYLLSRHPDIQSRLRSEVREKLPSSSGSGAVSAADFDVNSMPYLNAVCNEVLRLYPPVPHVLRGTKEDTHIAGNFIPKDTIIILPIWPINNSTSLWGSDAGEFNPDRWMKPGQAGSGGTDSNFANMTFLHGPRSCIGQAFAKGEFLCLVAAMVGAFEMRPVEGEGELVIVGDLTNKPKDGTWAMMREVEG